jgi:hypothetical protein
MFEKCVAPHYIYVEWQVQNMFEKCVAPLTCYIYYVDKT